MITPAVRDVLAERERHVSEEGFTVAHDDEHGRGELSAAATCYAMVASNSQSDDPIELPSPPSWWPWGRQWWKPGPLRRNLVKAAALLIAEIERLDRAAPSRSRSAIRCSIPYAMNTSAAGEQPCPNCGWPICEHPLRRSAGRKP